MRCLFCLTLIGFAVMAPGAPPLQFNYQARLTDSGGAPLQGIHNAYFGIYQGGDSSTANSGANAYSETVAATVTNGILNQTVGTGTVTSGSLSDSVFAFAGPVYLQVAIDSPTNYVLPRHQLQSVPFALRSRATDQADTAANGVPSGSIIFGDSPVPPAGFSPTGSILFSTWYGRHDMPFPTAVAGVATANSKIYIVGGGSLSAGTTNSCTVFTPATNTFSEAAPMSAVRRRLAATELNGLVYAVGGFLGATPFATNEVFNPTAGALGTWTTKQGLTTQRGDHACASANGHVYVFGGIQVIGSPLNSVEEYDTGSNSWSFKTPMPTPRAGCVAANIDGQIYVVGGADAFSDPVTANERFDPVGNSWSGRAPLPVARSFGSCAVFGGKLYYIGGLDDMANVAADTWIYDPVLNTWISGPSLSAPRYQPAAAAVSGRIYAIGGADFNIAITGKNEAMNAGVYFPFSKN